MSWNENFNRTGNCINYVRITYFVSHRNQGHDKTKLCIKLLCDYGLKYIHSNIRKIHCCNLQAEEFFFQMNANCIHLKPSRINNGHWPLWSKCFILMPVSIWANWGTRGFLVIISLAKEIE